jgi:cobaltochelatase CobN
MHLLAAKPGSILDGSEAVELRQAPGEIIFLSAADTELAALAAAQAAARPAAPSLRLANLMALGHNLSVDRYVESVVAGARLVVVRLLGGVRYWPYGIERIAALARERAIALAALPGDDQPDPELAALSTLPADAVHRLWRFCVEGGAENMTGLLAYAAALIGCDTPWHEPVAVPRAGLYAPGRPGTTLAERLAEGTARPAALLVFYRALVQSGATAPIDALAAALEAAGLRALPLFVATLKDGAASRLIGEAIAAAAPSVILNATAFAVGQPGGGGEASPFAAAHCPVLQLVLSGGGEAAWRAGSQGLSARDIAMHVALPEVDGRILTRAVSFKAEARFDEDTECAILDHRPVPDRVAFVAALAAGWARLRAARQAERRIALVLANYPNRDGRIGNGVGLDTPAATIEVMRALAGAGYHAGSPPADGAALLERLLGGTTNAARRPAGVRWPLAEYRAFLAGLPAAVREAVEGRWGPPERDPFVADDAIHLPAHRFGNLVVGIQPARGYNIDPAGSYHDPALVPPHSYLAFYGWLRRGFAAHAVVHLGKHGNLEWLPGKALALSQDCFPEAALGPLPHLYPFIVNDPGEGSQAKRRAAAVIIDHLTPPLTRAESYGPLRDLERLVDEYYEAAGLDPRRCRLLRGQILELATAIGLDKDCGIAGDEPAESALAKLDNHLCELKELQIRDGLHVFGRAPAGEQLTDLLVALTRLPRGRGEGGDASLIRALAADLGLDGFDPLATTLAEPWTGPRPAALQGEGSWRTAGDTVERLELLARRLVAGEEIAPEGWHRSRAVLGFIAQGLRPSVTGCGAAEIAGLLAGLDGGFVAPGPSGAPTRGRLEVLPTGRNFYSVDTRLVPTPAAWQLGWKSACRLLERYRQEHGAWPRALALSAWGTANMRTGGDDIAQGLALLGVRPRWDEGSGRVAGFEILPLSVLDRPRVDVTLRISGFFRDAFPAQIDLFDSAARAVAALDEPPEENPLAARVARDAAQLAASGLDRATAERRAAHRVFGSKPGAYGAGLQALIDERGWTTETDLARAYLAWGGYAYGDGAAGAAEHRLFERRLAAVEGVLHNQDNREHDLLDSDDYYQFEGGLAAAVKALSGRRPAVYHNDHSRPEEPRIRSLEEEIARVVRGRVVNPKWIEGVMRHGYKGAFEMAATVDYLFAFAATTGAVSDHHFDAVFAAYLGDPRVRDFLLASNPDATREMAERLLEAQERGLWRPRSNAAPGELAALAGRTAGAAA